jgi:hypothetical protein
MVNPRTIFKVEKFPLLGLDPEPVPPGYPRND